MTQDLSFLQDIGIAPSHHRPYARKKLRITKGEIDEATLGGIALISESEFDEDNLASLDLRYWIVHPSGRVEKQHLIQLETERNGDNIDMRSLWVLGREISLYHEDNKHLAQEALRQIHFSMRQKQVDLPHIAKIFKDCHIEEIVGENLPLPGFDLDKRISFSPSDNFDLPVNEQGVPSIRIPKEAFQALAGFTLNTLDENHDFLRRDFLKARGTITQTRKRHMLHSQITPAPDLGHNIKSFRLTGTPIDTLDNRQDRQIARAVWQEQKNKRDSPLEYKEIELTRMHIMDQNMLGRGFKGVMSGLGVLSNTHAQMTYGDYPAIQDHLTSYGLLDTVSSTMNLPPEKGRLVMTSEGGNNTREIYPGVGEDIGGNCKTVETQWLDPLTGEVKKVGAIFDLGSYIIKKSAGRSAALPDVVEKLKYSQDIFITHHHSDHLDALIPYIKRGLITKNHKVHLTPEVYEKLDEKLRQWGIKKDDPRRPHFNLLQGTGVVHIHDEQGKKRLTVLYGVDAVPHSARDTPFIAYARNGKEILGSYQYLGDMRYDDKWLAMHNSSFWDPAACMRRECPKAHAYMVKKNRKDKSLPQKARAYLQTLYPYQENPDALSEEVLQDTIDHWHFIPTFAELDATSIKIEGRAPSEKEVEENLTHMLLNWFPDKHAGVAVIGTNDGRRETLLRVANHTGRNGTEFGSAVQTLFRIANKWGVNPYLVERPKSAKHFLSTMQEYGIGIHQVKPPPTSYYKGLHDYLTWHAQENDLAPMEFKERTTKTVRDWFQYDPPGTLLAVLSGSQGNPIEVESMTYQLADGRSHWDAVAMHRKTARPTDLKNWAILFSQSAIPGNQEHQAKLIRRIAGRGAITTEAFGDNTRIHNPGACKHKILDDLVVMGRVPPNDRERAVEVDGSIVVENFPTHASGHGRREDNRLWIRHKIVAKQLGLHHTDNQESIMAGYDLIEEEGRAHNGTLIENGVNNEISLEGITEIGRQISSLIVTEEIKEEGKEYNKNISAKRIVNLDDRSPHHELGLRGSSGGAHETHFGVEDMKDLKKRSSKGPFDKARNRSHHTRPKSRRMYQGMRPVKTPPWNPNLVMAA